MGLVYDPVHRVSSITFGQGSPVAGTYTFAYNGGSTTVTNPNSHQTTYAFDDQQRLAKITAPLSNSVQFAWTADNHVRQYTDTKNQNFTYSYDANNNLTAIQLPTGATTSWAYTDASHPYYPTSVTGPQGNTTTIHYTAAGNPDVITNQLPSQNQTQLVYNPNGTVDHVVDACGNTTSMAYDGKGNLTKVTPPAPVHATTIVPDALSRAQGVTDGNATQRTYSYDPLDRTTALQYPSYPAGNVSWGFDNDGNLTSRADNAGTTSYQYDARNRNTQKALPASLGGGTFQYGWDGAGNLTSYADAGGTVTYHYNAADELDWLKDPGGAQTTFQYDQNHHRTSTAYPNGVTETQTYEAGPRLSNVTAANGSATLLNLTYGYLNGSGQDTTLVYTITESDAPGVGPNPTRNWTTTRTYN